MIKTKKKSAGKSSVSSYKTKLKIASDIGIKLDGTMSLRGILNKSEILKDVFGSDHAPILLEIE